MNISMWMLADRLSAYRPKCQIHEGKRTLHNVRILSEASKMSPYTVYLSQISDGKIALIHGTDIIYVTCDDIHQLLEDVQDIFEFLNDWRAATMERVNALCSLEELLHEFCMAEDQYYILADSTYYVLEQCGLSVYPGKNERAKSVLKNRIMPVELLEKVNRFPYVRMPGQPSYLIDLPELDTVSCVTNIFTGAEHRGWLIANNVNSTFTQGMMDLQDEMGAIVEYWLSKNRDYEKAMNHANIFLEILNGTYQNKEMVLHRLAGFSWFEHDPKICYAVFSPGEESDHTYLLERLLQQSQPALFMVRDRNLLFILADLRRTRSDVLEEQLTALLKKYDCYAGKSQVFTDIFQLCEVCATAEVAGRYAQAPRCGITRIENTLMPYILHILAENSYIPILHPALDRLAAYDRAHHTAFYASLYEFLKEERNLQRAAAKLHIHRSTLLYRISRIEELADLDLEDHRQRLHLLLSYEIQMQNAQTEKKEE